MDQLSFKWLAPWLTALSKRIGIDLHYFAKNSFLVSVSHVVNIVRGIISGYFVARLFEKEIYGQYQFILSVMSMLAMFGLPGLMDSVTRALARKEKFSMQAIVLHQGKICAIASIVLLSCIPFLEYYHRESLWPLFVAAAIIFPLPNIAQILFGAPVVGLSRFDIALKANIIWSIINIICTVVILYYTQSAFLMLITSTVIAPITYIMMSKKIQPEKDLDEENTKEIIRYGWQLTLRNLPNDLAWYIDKLIISQFLGLNQLATFSVSILIPEQVKGLVKQFVPIAFAKQAARSDSKEMRQKLLKVVASGMGIFTIGIIVYTMISPWIIPFLFPKYHAHEVIFLTNISAITLVMTPTALLGQYLDAQKMVREIQIANWGSACIFALALVTIVPLYGLIGAVIARGIFRFMYGVTTCWFVLRAPIKENKTMK